MANIVALDAVVIAGGVPKPGDPLYSLTRGRPKALLEAAGKSLLQWVLDALGTSDRVRSVLVIGLGDDAASGAHCLKPVSFLGTQGNMLANVRAGLQRVAATYPDARHALVVGADVPTITPETVAWVVDTAMQTDHDICYSVIERSVMEKRFPESKRTYTRMKGTTVCGGDMNVIAIRTATGANPIWDQIIEARKNVLKQAALVGWGPFWGLLTAQLTLEQAQVVVRDRLGVNARVLRCPFAEVGMDVDKPSQLELVRRHLRSRNGNGAR